MDSGAIPPSIPITVVNNHSSTSTGSKSASVSPGIITILVVVMAIIIILCIAQFIRRRYFRHSHGSSYVRPLSRTIGNGSDNTSALSEHERLKQIDSLPLVTLASSMDKLPKSIHDCAVCYEPFLPDSVLRLLPACCHAFHKRCIDTWLVSNPSCPMCRSSITLPYRPLQGRSSRSFRIELGNISLKRSESASSLIQNLVPPIRTYSMESHNYHIGEEIEIVPLRSPVINREKSEIDIPGIPPSPPPPSPPLASSSPPPTPQTSLIPPLAPPIESLAREEPVRGWLQDFLETLSSAASSMRFPSQRWNETLSSAASSRRFPSQRWSGTWSGRWSQRFDSGVGVEPPPDTWLWDLETGQSEAAGGVVAAYRWLTGM